MRFQSFLTTFAVLTASVMTFAAHAVEISNPKFIRALDGRMQRCERPVHQGNSRWTLETPALRSAGGGVVEFSGRMQFFSCVELDGDKAGWRAGRVEEPVQRTDVHGRKYSRWTKEREFVVINSRWQALSADALPAASSVGFKKSFTLDEILSTEQQYALNSGRTIRGFMALFPRAKHFYQYEGAVAKPLGLQLEQAYYIWFNARKTVEGLQFEIL